MTAGVVFAVYFMARALRLKDVKAAFELRLGSHDGGLVMRWHGAWGLIGGVGWPCAGVGVHEKEVDSIRPDIEDA